MGFRDGPRDQRNSVYEKNLRQVSFRCSEIEAEGKVNRSEKGQVDSSDYCLFW